MSRCCARGATLRRLRALPQTEPAPLNEELLKKAAGQLAASYDAEYGGFGSSPKFPGA